MRLTERIKQLILERKMQAYRSQEIRCKSHVSILVSFIYTTICLIFVKWSYIDENNSYIFGDNSGTLEEMGYAVLLKYK